MYGEEIVCHCDFDQMLLERHTILARFKIQHSNKRYDIVHLILEQLIPPQDPFFFFTFRSLSTYLHLLYNSKYADTARIEYTQDPNLKAFHKFKLLVECDVKTPTNINTNTDHQNQIFTIPVGVTYNTAKQ